MGLKERMASRQPPQTTIRLRMDFSPESDAALRVLATAEADLDAAKARREADLLSWERAVERAKASAETFHENLVVRAISPDDMDALIEAHPPTSEQKTDPDHHWGYDPHTFGPALLAACVTCVEADGTESRMGETDWSDLLHKGPVSGGEVRLLVDSAYAINDRSPDASLGKG